MPRVFWTLERIDRMRDLASLGFSSSMIARELGGVSPSAVVCKCRREGIPLTHPAGRKS